MIAALLDLARLSLALGEEERVTLHPDGRRETVATHSHMLAMVACSVATKANHALADKHGLGSRWYFANRFRIGLVAQFATVHDVPEVAPGGPGDVDTFLTTDPEILAEKNAAEDAAIERLAADFPTWLGPLIVRYRRQEEPEARLVRYLDKVLPKITLALSECLQFRRNGTTEDYFEEFVWEQANDLAEQYPELADLVGPIYGAMNDEVRAAWGTAWGTAT